MNQRGIGISNLPNLRYSSVMKSGTDFNVMIVGSAGLGKTTFMNHFVENKLLYNNPFETTRDAEMKDIFFYKDGLLNVQISNFSVIENEFETRMTVTDINGIGDNVSNDRCWEPFVGLIQSNFHEYENNEQRSVRSMIHDNRIHLCFYFLDPSINFIRDVDKKTMKNISTCCNIIPIIAKSDLLSETQRQQMFDYVRSVIDAEQIEVFEDPSLVGEEESSFAPPFFIVNGTYEGTTMSYKRVYPWGTSNTHSISGNDFFKLREALLTESFLKLLETTEYFYDNFRTQQLALYLSKPGLFSAEEKKMSKDFFDMVKNNEEEIRAFKERIRAKKEAYENQYREESQVVNE